MYTHIQHTRPSRKHGNRGHNITVDGRSFIVADSGKLLDDQGRIMQRCASKAAAIEVACVIARGW